MTGPGAAQARNNAHAGPSQGEPMAHYVPSPNNTESMPGLRREPPYASKTIRTDVAVIGAGPAGSAAALALAGRGLAVQLVGPVPAPVSRLAGEWVHPGGLAALERLGVRFTEEEGWRQRGFIVHPGDGSPPIALDYTHGATALSLPHHVLLSALHRKLAAHPGVTWRTGLRAIGLAGRNLLYTGRDPDDSGRVQARLVVGADGRSCVLRDTVGLRSRPVTLSHMLGLLLHDVTLPDPDYGHLILGGPGPVVAYHLSPRTVRVCIDLPLDHPRPPHLATYLHQVYPPSLLDTLHYPVQTALREGRGQWATNRVQPRGRFAHPHCILIGDAAGHTHPLTAIGLSMGFLDAECLGRTGDVREYVRSRTAPAAVSERLAVGVHQLLTATDPAQHTASRHHLPSLAPGSRPRPTLHGHARLICTRPADLRNLGLRVMSAGFADSLRDAVHHRSEGGLVQEMRSGTPWLTWLGGGELHRSR